MSVTMNVIRDEGKRIPIELARTLYGEIGVAIEKYFGLSLFGVGGSVRW